MHRNPSGSTLEDSSEIDMDALIDFSRIESATMMYTPFPHAVIENLFTEEFVSSVTDSYPGFEEMSQQGRLFEASNELHKVQLTDQKRFPPAVADLGRILNSQRMLDALSNLTGIQNLIGDPTWEGGGMHSTGPRGHLDVHIDFNIDKRTGYHRRLNLLLYLNKEWPDEWGGQVELWDPDVKNLELSLLPRANRCLIFETSEISFHGVAAVRCPPNIARKSFAAYYYTREPPPNGKADPHTTVFKGRPHEHGKKIQIALTRLRKNAKQKLRSVVKRDDK